MAALIPGSSKTRTQPKAHSSTGSSFRVTRSGGTTTTQYTKRTTGTRVTHVKNEKLGYDYKIERPIVSGGRSKQLQSIWPF